MNCPYCHGSMTPIITSKTKTNGYIVLQSSGPIDLAKPIEGRECVQICPLCRSEVFTPEFEEVKRKIKETVDDEFTLLGIILLLAGIVLAIIGFVVLDSMGVGWDEQTPYDKETESFIGTMLLVGGGIGAVLGLIMIFSKSD